MLESDKPDDTEVVKRWLISALEAGKKSGKTATGLAQHCDTTPQAVNGWKKTGRITKTNLEKATQYFGHGPSFTGSTSVREETAFPWPFPGIDRRKVLDLDSDDLIRLETALLLSASQLGIDIAAPKVRRVANSR